MSEINDKIEKGATGICAASWATEVINQMHTYQSNSDKLSSTQAGTGGPGTGDSSLGPLTIEHSGGDSGTNHHGPFSGGRQPVGDQKSYAYKIPLSEEKGHFGHN